MMEETTDELFKCFDVVSDDSDHYYVGKKVEGNIFTDTNSSVYKRIAREWRILDKNLPESIYVCTYENRIDLMRAVIIGAAGTPYHDSLFFFDIRFPVDYPNSPPKLRCRSFGYSINPNIYSSGKVCLSLLNTWRGDQSEKWDPSNSTLFQVLLSIQALVLNEDPFYNEIPELRRWQSKSTRVHYNERIFINTCKTTLSLIHNPPKNFASFVTAHFRERGRVILAACKEYANERVRVGYYGYTGGGRDQLIMCSSFHKEVNVSTDFQDKLQRLYPQLVEAFGVCGASLEPCLNHLELQKNSSQNNHDGIFKKARAKVKQALAMKKSSGKNKGDLYAWIFEK